MSVFVAKKADGSAHVYELKALSELALQGGFEDLMVLLGQFRVVGNDFEGILASQAKQIHIVDDVSHAELR